jgi:L-threonylcarbamoyladenylate synthase
VGLESTVLDVSSTTPCLLRPGGVTVEAIEDVIGPVESAASPPPELLRSPGLLPLHYAPQAYVRFPIVSVAPNEALLAFGTPLPGAGIVFNLSEKGDLAEAASRLFTGMRKLDEAAAALRLECIAVMSVPNRGLGRAINDRLRRAAAPRRE